MRRYDLRKQCAKHHIFGAEDWIEKDIQAYKRNGVRFNLGKDYALYTELFKRKRDTQKAKENLSKAMGYSRNAGPMGGPRNPSKHRPQSRGTTEAVPTPRNTAGIACPDAHRGR